MKKLLLIAAFVLLLLCCCSAFGQNMNLSQMSFDELNYLRQGLEFEFRSRPEFEPFTLCAGEYTGGKDVPASDYYFYRTNLSENQTVLKIADDSDSYTYYPSFSTLTRVTVSDGAVITINDGSVTFSINPVDLDEIHGGDNLPGVVIPQGYYIIGRDIPSGVYIVSLYDDKYADVCLYPDRSAFSAGEYGEEHRMWLGTGYEEGNSSEAFFTEGAVLVCSGSVYLEKQEDLIFK